MPQIPTFENTQAVPAAHIDPAEAGRVAESIARGGAEIEGVAGTWAQRYAESRRAVMASDAMVSAQSGLQQSAQQWARKAGTTDENGEIVGTDQAVNGFVDAAQHLRAQTLGHISDPLVQAMVAEHFDQAQIAHAETVRGQGFALEREARIGKTDLDLAGLANSAATAATPEERALHVTTAITAINSLRDAGFMTGAEAATRQIKFGSDVQKVQALRYIRDASTAMEQGRLTPLDVADTINDAKNFPGLLPTERQSLADTAIRLGRTIVSMQMANQSAADSAAAKALKATQQANEIDILSGIRSGKNVPTTDDLDRLGKAQAISLPGYQAIDTALTKREKGQNDLATLNDLLQRVARGEDVHEDVLRARSGPNPLLSETTAEELLKGNAARGRGEESAVAKGAFDELKTALGGHSIEKGIVDLTDEAGRAQTALWAEAQGEWNRRVRVGSEDPQMVLADMLPRYQRPPQTPQAWPRPRLGAVKSLDDVNAVGAATWKAREDGTIDATTYDREVELLNRYRQYYLQAPAPAPAPKTAGGRAKLKNLSAPGTEP